MITVGPSAGNLQIKIDLCRSKGLDAHRGSAAASGPRRRHAAAVELGLDWFDLVLLRPELQRPTPLIACLHRTAALPIGIAQMIVDCRVFGYQLDRLFEVLHCARVIAEPVMRPAQAIDNVAILGPQLYRLLDHFEATI